MLEDEWVASFNQYIDICMHECKAALTLIIVVSIHAHHECMHARTSCRTSYRTYSRSLYVLPKSEITTSDAPFNPAINPEPVKSSGQASKQARMIEDGGCDGIHHAMQMPIELVWLLSWAMYPSSSSLSLTRQPSPSSYQDNDNEVVSDDATCIWWHTFACS